MFQLFQTAIIRTRMKHTKQAFYIQMNIINKRSEISVWPICMQFYTLSKTGWKIKIFYYLICLFCPKRPYTGLYVCGNINIHGRRKKTVRHDIQLVFNSVSYRLKNSHIFWCDTYNNILQQKHVAIFEQMVSKYSCDWHSTSLCIYRHHISVSHSQIIYN